MSSKAAEKALQEAQARIRELERALALQDETIGFLTQAVAMHEDARAAQSGRKRKGSAPRSSSGPITLTELAMRPW